MKNIQLDEGEELFLPIVWTGKEDNIEYSINLSGRGAQISVIGIILGQGQDNLELRINVLHNAPETKSNVILKGILQDQSSVNFEGLVKIEKGAKGTNTWLAAHLLLLSDKARGRAIPSLEILENDIKAGHAATVGKINEIEMFYLMSRGLSKKQAKSLIVEGFLQSLIETFPESQKQKAQKQIENFHYV